MNAEAREEKVETKKTLPLITLIVNSIKHEPGSVQISAIRVISGQISSTVGYLFVNLR
jgi:hypothetical protein